MLLQVLPVESTFQVEYYAQHHSRRCESVNSVAIFPVLYKGFYSPIHVRGVTSLPFSVLTYQRLCVSAGQTYWTTQRVSFEPPATEPLCYLRHGVRLASPAWETHPGLLWIRGNCKSSSPSQHYNISIFPMSASCIMLEITAEIDKTCVFILV